MTPRVPAVIAATLFAIATPAIQAGAKLGLSAKEFSAAGDATLRAAPYAFGIWSLIYLGLVVYAVVQARKPNAPLVRAVGWPSVAAIAGCGLWIIVSAADWKAASVLVILASAAAAITAIWRAPWPSTWVEHGLVLAPLTLLAGWLTVASGLNVLNVLTAFGVITAASAQPAVIAAVAIVTVISLIVVQTRGLFLFAAPIAWGLIGVWVAEQAVQPTRAGLALSAALIVAAHAVLVAVLQGLRGVRAVSWVGRPAHWR